MDFDTFVKMTMAQKLVTDSINKAVRDGNVKLAIAAAAGAGALGVAILAHEYGGTAAKAVSETAERVATGVSNAANEASSWLVSRLTGWFSSPQKGDGKHPPTIEGESEPGFLY